MSADDQLDLFGSSEKPNPPVVGPAPVDEGIQHIVDRLPSHVRLGTSSWTFPGWFGLIYDQQVTAKHLAEHGLAAYARHPLLRTVGIDRSFYAPLEQVDYERYAAAVPDGFEFVVKAAAAVTSLHQFDKGANGRRRARQNPYFLDPEFAARQVIAPAVRGLGSKLGVILFQFPPLELAAVGYRKGFVQRIRAFVSALPRGPRYAFEVRNHQLLTHDYVETLRAFGAVHCFASHPNMHEIVHQRKWVDPRDDAFVVGRWMLGHHRRYEQARAAFHPFARLMEPDVRTRRGFIALIERSAGRPMFLIVSNNAEGSAPLSIQRLAYELIA